MSRLKKFGVLSLALVTAALTTAPPESPVADAAERGDVEAVRDLLRQGADVNAAQGDGMTALHWSALHGEKAMVDVLLYAGAHVEPATRLGGYTPLHLASHKGHAAVVQSLLGAGGHVEAVTTTGVTALHLASDVGDPGTIRALLAHGADVNVRDTYQGRTPLMFATARAHVDAVQALLEAGADVAIATEVVDYAERTKADNEARRLRAAILKAARGETADQEAERPSGQQPDTTAAEPDTTKAEPEQAALPDPDQPTQPDPDRPTPPDPDEPPPGATHPDPHAQPDSARRHGAPGNDSSQVSVASLSYSDLVGKQGGFTALHYAARDGRLKAARLLLAAGADVNELTGGDRSSPLLVAVINGNYDLALMLLEAGADPNLVSEDGAGPLFAVVNGRWALRTWYPQPTAWQQQQTDYLDLMRALLEAGAEPNQRVNTHIWYAAYNAGRMGVDFAGATPFWRAAYSLDVEAMRLLHEFGADPNIRTRKPAPRRRFGPPRNEDEKEEDPSGLPPVPAGGPAVHPLHAASGVGYGTSRVGQQHRHVPDGWLPAVKFLVDELSVDVNVRDHDGYSAVHNAAARGDNEMIQFLVDRGADVMGVSRRGQTTVDMANGPQQRVQPFPETIALLEGLGAKNNDNCLSC